MSATEELMERVKTYDEARARIALDLLASLPAQSSNPPAPASKPVDVFSMIGYAKKYNHELKTTEEWMKELRGGEQED